MHHFHHDVLSPVATILVAFCSTLFAIRLIRELAVAQRQGAMEGNADPVTPGVVAVETAGSQPFRPFQGRGYRLTRSTPVDEPKDTTVLVGSSRANAPSVGPA